MDEKREKTRSVYALIRREALKGTPPRQTCEMVRTMIAQDPSLLDIDIPEQLAHGDGSRR